MSATRNVANGAAAAALALALSGDMHLTPPAAMAAPPAVIQQVGTTSLLAVDTADLSDEQKAFLREREKMATKYEMRTESTYKSAEEVRRRAKHPLHPPPCLSSAPMPEHVVVLTGAAPLRTQVKDKKNVYTAIVGGLIVVAFVAPMVQFFWYTGGE